MKLALHVRTFYIALLFFKSLTARFEYCPIQPQDSQAEQEATMLRVFDEWYGKKFEKVKNDSPRLSDLSRDSAVLKMLPQSLDFWIVDLKYSPERGVTIIEFGHGFQSGFKVLDRTVKKGVVYSHAWRTLHALNVPLWYVGRNPGNNNWVAWDEFRGLGGQYASALHRLERDPFFRSAALGDGKKKGAFAGCKGIIVMRYASAKSHSVKELHRRYPGFIVPGVTTKRYVKNKQLTDQMFDTDFLASYRPKCNLYPRVYDKDLAQRIIKDLGCEWYVIKPINSGRGNGILFVQEHELDKTLKLILDVYNNNRPVNNSYSYKTNREMTYEYWKHDRNEHFLVEEYVHSRPILFRNKHYDATMRVAFLLGYDRGKVYIDFLDAYWKRPIKALEDEGTFREKHISKHKPNFQESLGGFVGQEDKKAVYEDLKNILPGIYLNMLIDHHIERLPNGYSFKQPWARAFCNAAK